MSLVLGTDTYITLEEADAYIADYGPDGAEVTEPQLRRATLAIDRLYGGQFAGVPADADQPLQFPRLGEFGIPTQVAQATVELALLSDSVDVYAQPTALLTEEATEIAGAIKTSSKYATAYAVNPLHKVTLILAPLLVGTSTFTTVDVVRA